MAFQKICKICGTPFTSESRTTKYCSDPKCHKTANKKNKAKQRRRRQYRSNREVRIIESHVRKEARDYAVVNFEPWDPVEKKEYPWSELEVHHIDSILFKDSSMKEFNNQGNLVPLSVKTHYKVQAIIDKLFKEIEKAMRRRLTQQEGLRKRFLERRISLEDFFTEIFKRSEFWVRRFKALQKEYQDMISTLIPKEKNNL